MQMQELFKKITRQTMIKQGEFSYEIFQHHLIGLYRKKRTKVKNLKLVAISTVNDAFASWVKLFNQMSKTMEIKLMAESAMFSIKICMAWKIRKGNNKNET